MESCFHLDRGLAFFQHQKVGGLGLDLKRRSLAAIRQSASCGVLNNVQSQRNSNGSETGVASAGSFLFLFGTASLQDAASGTYSPQDIDGISHDYSFNDMNCVASHALPGLILQLVIYLETNVTLFQPRRSLPCADDGVAHGTIRLH
jgi:hypothetical protein